MNTKSDSQRRYFDSIASGYDDLFQRLGSNHRYKIERIAAALLEAPTLASVLEIGAGTGVHAEYLWRHHAARFGTLDLVEPSEKMLDLARKRLRPLDAGNRILFIAATGEAFRSPKRYDAIYVSSSLHHFSDPVAGLRNIVEHLKPGGRLVLCEPNVWNPVNFLRATIHPHDWGQFVVTRRAVRRELCRLGVEILADQVLHWRGSAVLAKSLWPVATLERTTALDPAAVMFLFVVRRPLQKK